MVSGLLVEDVTVRYGSVVGVQDADLTVEPGSVVALLGPSGCGKSTLLRAIAGLEPLAAGRISWDGADLSRVPVHRRNFGMVFQDGQLFSTMSVGRNIGYGLTGLSRPAQEARVTEMLELVGLPGYAARQTTELSGGQAQRVALARSLAPAPRALLLDEPLSALDTGLRRRLARDLARILRETETTAVYVTHDHQEAYTVADRVAVMDAGRILQVGDPEVLRHRPAERTVAQFLGFTAFISQADARALGWTGELPPAYLLGIGSASLQLDPDGVALPIIEQTLTVDDVQVGVRLPDGQAASVSSPSRIDAETVSVRLIDGAITPSS
ncbi:MAG: ABC transporter ATP-binding protein [Actinomycetia bacterium]|nr:ABC transporter ATP-binding protein [Actinomycetes bacterium]